MGHGNGWPSPYRNALFPPTQNGFGLNPIAGSERQPAPVLRRAERSRRDPARTERRRPAQPPLLRVAATPSPGSPEGTLAQARQRVDNFAAGFIKAGAPAVVAEAYVDPNHMVRCGPPGPPLDRVGLAPAPSANGHTFGFESSRSPGYVAEMDPDNSRSGFHRSIVLRKGLASKDVLANGRGAANGRGGGSSVVSAAEEEAAADRR